MQRREAATLTFRALLLLLCWLGLSVPAGAVDVPPLSARVTDLTGMFDAGARAQIESRLATFEKEKGSQVAVLILPSTQPETIEQYAIRVVDAWKLGRAGVDDGVLLIAAMDDRTLRIEVGKGLEGAIPDALAKRIIEETLVPAFREGQFAAGIERSVDQILGLIRGEPLPEPAASSGGGGEKNSFSELGSGLFVGALVVGQMLRIFLGRLLGATVGGVAALLIGGWLFGWLAGALAGVVVFFIVLVVEASGGVGGGGFRSGGSSYGGGGFSGGGGGFSGGGASGRW